jgi:hypothetical protein
MSAGAAAHCTRSTLPPFGEHRHGRADLAVRAVAALKSVPVDERPLHRVQLPILRQSFDRLDLPVLVLDGNRQTRIDALAVHKHGARRRPLDHNLFRAGEPQVGAQRVQQRYTRFDRDGMRRAVHSQNNL